MKEKVLITGGNGDIAKALTDLLKLEGYDVKAPGKNEMDVTDIQSIEACISNYKPDILVNNAGYVVPKSIKEADLENSKRHIDINLGVYFTVQR